ncbi:MAG: hypothetical protein ACM3ZV_07520 [Bacillota bacterium]
MRHQKITAAPPIHPAWCRCHRCSASLRRGQGPELLALALGAGAALALVAIHQITPIAARAVEALF